MDEKYTVRSYEDKTPTIPKSCTIMENVVLCGDILLGEECVIMPNTVMRAEHNPIVVGYKTNIQDLCCIHTELGEGGEVTIGDFVTIGHGAILHGCTIKNRAVIGMGAIVLDGAVIEEEAMVAAGAVVAPFTVIEKRSMAVGIPAKSKRPLKEKELNDIEIGTDEYLEYAQEYRKHFDRNK